MQSSNPPVINHQLPSTPSSEWANSTASALEENLKNPQRNTDPSIPHFADTTTTTTTTTTILAEERQLPGSFPRGADLSAPPTIEDTKRAGQGMLESARQYIPAQKDVQNVLQNVAESAKPYLPAAVSSYLPDNNNNHSQSQVPSGDVSSASGPHTGVGSLSGDPNEANVSKSPLERAAEGTSNVLPGRDNLPSREVPGGSRTGVGSLPGDISESGLAKLPDERPAEGNSAPGVLSTAQQSISNAGESVKQYLPQSVAAYMPGSQSKTSTTLPSSETPSGSNVGVGSLPGTISEVSVAKLPEERRQESLPSHDTNNEVLGKTGGVGPLPGGPDETRVALLPEERAHPQNEILESSKGGLQSAVRTALPSPPKEESRELSKGGLGSVQTASPHAHSQDKGIEPSQGVLGTVPHTSLPTNKSEAVSKDLKVQEGGNLSEELVKQKRPEPSYGSGYHPAELHPIDAGSNDSNMRSSQSATGSGVPHADDKNNNNTSNTSPTSTGGEHHKVGLMSKIKGEAKVIAGKLGHDEKKVEEGRHMMGK